MHIFLTGKFLHNSTININIFGGQKRAAGVSFETQNAFFCLKLSIIDLIISADYGKLCIKGRHRFVKLHFLSSLNGNMSARCVRVDISKAVRGWILIFFSRVANIYIV